MSIEKLRFRKTDLIVVEGVTTPGATVVIENKSIAPFAPNDTPDAFIRGRAGPDGKFTIELPGAHEGDQLQLRAESKGETLGAVSVRLSEAAPVDGRIAVVRQQGLRLVPAAGGRFKFVHVCKSTVVGEPEQHLQIKNKRTGDKVLFTLDDNGRLPADARLEGKPGDSFELATSDGVHNKDFSSTCGLVVAPPTGDVEPAAMTSGNAGALRPFGAPLFADGGPLPNLVQGQIGDCWLVSAADVIAAQRPELLRNIIRENDDGTYTVTFKRYHHERKSYVDEDITVTNALYANYAGKPVYGATKTGELWFSILEKAYAKWKGGYDGVRSGYPFEAFEALLGHEGRHFDPDVTKPDDLYDALDTRLKNGEAAVAWTRVDTPALNFANTGLAQDHAYGVMGVQLVDGERFIKVRNPWGNNPYRASNSPLGLRVVDNATVLVPLESFVSHFAGVGSAPTR